MSKRKKRIKRKKREKVKAPAHWNPDFDSNSLKRDQQKDQD